MTSDADPRWSAWPGRGRGAAPPDLGTGKVRGVYLYNHGRLRTLLRALSLAALHPHPDGRATCLLSEFGAVSTVRLLYKWLAILASPFGWFMVDTGRFTRLVLLAARDLRGGDNIPAVLERHFRRLLPAYWRVLLRQAEARGTLPETLLRLAGQPLGWREAVHLRTDPLWLLWYQTVVSFMVFSAIMVFIRPNFLKLWGEYGVTPTLHPAWVIMRDATWYGLGVVAGGGLVLFLLRDWGWFRWLLEILLRHLPWLGRAARWRHQSELAIALACLLPQVPRLEEALALLREDADSPWTRRRLQRAEEALRAGQDWLTVWQAHKLVDAADVWLLAQAWRVGQPARAFETLGLLLCERQRQGDDLWRAWSQPLQVAPMGIVVGVLVTEAMMGLITLTDTLLVM